MPAPDAKRIQTKEGGYTFISRRLSDLLLEIDSRLTGRGMFVRFFRTNGYITRTEFYRDEAKTNLAISRDYTRVSGSANIEYVSGVVTTFYETDGITVDSVVSGFLERDLTVSGQDFIIGCSGFFDTSESQKL